VHSPPRAAAETLRLLRPGGRAWFCQPNLGAAGLSCFGRFWRGLEAPRHLALFDPDAFIAFLERAGFSGIELLPARGESRWSFMASLAMSEGLPPTPGQPSRGWSQDWETRARAAERASARSPRVAENFTIIAHRPSGR
jgi:SAM-dependent methyltransferase